MKDKGDYGKNYWLQKIGTPEYISWSGYAFETVCLHHIDQIVNALGISGAYYSPCSWSYRPSEAVKNDSDADEDLKTGGQIDLLIDRKDKTISICEMKYAMLEYEITKEYDRKLKEKVSDFKNSTGIKSSIYLTIVTTYGLKPNKYSGHVQSVVTAADLFEPSEL